MAAAILSIGMEGDDIALLPIRNSITVAVIVGLFPSGPCSSAVRHAVTVGVSEWTVIVTVAGADVRPRWSRCR